MEEKVKLQKHQAEAAATKARLVVLRWARRTGKDYLIEHIRGEHDFAIMPRTMAAESAEEYENRWVFRDYLVNDELLTFIKSKQTKHNKTKHIFLNECAFFEVELLPLIIKLQKFWPKAQIYLVSTPRGGWKLGERGSAGFEFDLLCGRLEMSKVHEHFYSRYSAPKKSWPDGWAMLSPKFVEQELKAGWWDI